MRDTPPRQALKHAQLLAQLTPEQRIDALRAVDRGVRRLVLARLRHQFRDASEQELVIRHVAQVHGVEVARRVYKQAVPADLR
ncbi:MAG: hypothetical protein INH41_04510 [Myxococcaceae bacterium]|jgi:hypothetical protein|nr:hypothetical protein [Myxococcaceae bacterium]MCA3011646.1 hypothetical protein [Myxococcaceae bacterium]